MSAFLEVENYAEANIKERFGLSADAPIGTTTLAVGNDNNIAADDFILIGELGREKSELRQVASVAANVATIPATENEHLEYDPGYVLYANQIKVYRAINVDGTDPGSTAYTYLNTVDIDVDQLVTHYIDDGGGDGFWYRYTYYNSENGSETLLADSVGVRGGGSLDYCGLDEIRRRAGFQNNPHISDVTLHYHRAAAQAEINSSLYGLYSVPFAEPINAIVEDVCINLAAGFLLRDEYGPTTNNTTKEGNERIDDARGMLKMVKSKDIILLDSAGGSMAIENDESKLFSSYPNAESDALGVENGGTTRMFTMAKRY